MSEVSNPINEKNKQIKTKKKTKVKKIKLKKQQRKKTTQVLLTKSIIVDIQNVPINFSTSFMTLVFLIERETENVKYFNYEITPGPTSLLLLYK